MNANAQSMELARSVGIRFENDLGAGCYRIEWAHCRQWMPLPGYANIGPLEFPYRSPGRVRPAYGEATRTAYGRALTVLGEMLAELGLES